MREVNNTTVSADLIERGLRASDLSCSFMVDHAPGGTYFWHPDLPEVASCTAYRFSGKSVRTETRIKVPGGMRFNQLLTPIALLLALALPATAQQAPCKVNVQNGTVEQLSLLPGVGPATAAAIQAAKPTSETELDAVKGIGPKKFEAIRPHAVYGAEQTTCTEKQKKAPAKGKE